MTTTALDPHARSKTGIFLETPEAIALACRALLVATNAALDCTGDYFEQKRLGEARRLAQIETEAVILAHQGGRSFLNGLYRVDGALIGMRKLRGGLELVVYTEQR